MLFEWPRLAVGDVVALTEYGAAQTDDPVGERAVVMRRCRPTPALGGVRLRHDSGRRWVLRYSEAMWRYTQQGTR